MPPVWMWHLPEELERHFERVIERRRSGRSSNDDDDDERHFMMRNEYAKGRGRHAVATHG